ncbi:MAG TPA: hypothetical protein VH062_35870 [Polyangiaceae bacterium]|jgi:hypothetical protein|nr:hypothetical protein [Polyangiaceae bacterium]
MTNLRLRSVALLVCAGTAGCSGVLAKGDGRAIGDDLGRFQIDAKLDTSTCGPDAEGVMSDFRLDVFLSEAPPLVYWNSGADSVEGDLDDDGVHFSFESETVVAVPSDVPAADTCTIVRKDTSSGAFDHATRVRHLTGSLEYRYAAQGSSDCATAMVSQGFTSLPCKMSFSMAGDWVSAR